MNKVPQVLIAFAFLLGAASAGCIGGDPVTNETAEPEDTGVIDPEGGPSNGAGGGAGIDFTVTPEPPRAGIDLQFDAGGSPGSGSGDENDTDSGPQYAWDFGDGRSGEGAQVTHSYQEGGMYTVTLQVMDDNGEGDNTTRDLAVLPPPEADLNETWDGDFPVGAPVESGSWVDEHDIRIDDAQTNVTLQLDGQGTGVSMDLYLLDENGDEVASETGGGASQTLELARLEAGSYTAKIHMTAGSTGTYELTATGTAAVPQPETGQDAGNGNGG